MMAFPNTMQAQESRKRPDLCLHNESCGEACQFDFSMLNMADPINPRFTKTDPDFQTR
jgi:hypothetical protein